MTEKIIVYQKPTCGKCRETLRILSERGVPLTSINYYEKPISTPLLRELLRKLGMTPRDLLRKEEPLARRLGILEQPRSDEELIRLMAENPDLIQRPIVVRGEKAVLGRPPSNVEKLLDL